eukprot:4847311-Pleurochrysis_carterae.AAC.1
MESDASSVDVSMVVSVWAGLLVDGFVCPNGPCRARFPQLHQLADAHREARKHTVLIADTSSRSYPDLTNPTQLTSTDVAAVLVDRELSRIPRYAGAGSRSGRAYFHLNIVTTFVLFRPRESAYRHARRLVAACDWLVGRPGISSQPDTLLPAAESHITLCAYRCRHTWCKCVRAVPRCKCVRAVPRCMRQLRARPWSASNVSQVQPQRIDYPRLTAKLREALDKQIAKREKNLDSLNAVGVHNNTIMVVESRVLEVQRVAKSSIDSSFGGAQFHSPTLHAFFYGLYNYADDVISTVDHVHKRIRYQLALSEKLLMPNICVPPIHTTALDTPYWCMGSFQAHHHGNPRRRGRARSGHGDADRRARRQRRDERTSFPGEHGRSSDQLSKCLNFCTIRDWLRRCVRRRQTSMWW